MTPSELKFYTRETESYYFTNKTMKFFGDTMKNYGVRSAVIDTYKEKNVEVWELYRKCPIKYGFQSRADFNKKTFNQ